jgi:hypothetical protein
MTMNKTPLNDKLLEAEQMAGRWLHYGNLAAERGDHALAERHYYRAQKWHDRMNDLLEKAQIARIKARSKG